MNKIIVLFLVIILVFINGCAQKSPLKSSLISKYSISNQELKNLQYYVSNRIDLCKEEKEIKRNQSGDMLTGNSNINREHVYILPNTPGIAESANPNELLISFEEGSSFKFITSPEEIDSYFRLKHDSTDNSTNNRLGSYVFNYRDKKFYSKRSGHVYLLIKKNDFVKITNARHKLKGRSVK